MKEVLEKYKNEISKKTLRGKGKLKFNYFIHIIDLNKEEVLLFNSLFLESKKISKKKLNDIKHNKLNKIDNELIQDLIGRGILVNQCFKFFDLTKTLESIFSAWAFNNLYLIPSSACNLRCKYCYVKNYNSGFNNNILLMTKKEAKSAIDLFFELSANGLKERTSDVKKITFFGGEPLVNISLLYFALKYIRSKYGQAHTIIIVTNGTLLNKKLINYLRDVNVKLVVSLDGPKEINKSYRDSKYYDKIIASLKYLSNISYNFSISCTMNPANSSKIIKILKWFKKEISPNGIDLNLPLPPLTKELKISDCIDLMWEGFLWGEKESLPVNPIFTKLLCLNNKTFYYDECGQGGGQIAFFPNKKVSVCHAMETNQIFTKRINEYNVRKIIDNKCFDEWNRCNCLNREDCLRCIAFGLCGGGCKFNNLVKKNNICINDEDYCRYQREITKRLLIYSYEKK